MSDFDIVVRIRLSRNGGEVDHSFGWGTAQLLVGVRDLKSLNKAAKEMGMAYSKAWTSIKKTESELGFELLERNGPGGSCLTPKGVKLLQLYFDLMSAADAACRDVVSAFEFGDE